MLEKIVPLVMLTLANVFMTFAWYGHLKNLKTSPLWVVILVSWGIAFFEYCLQVPANRWGFAHYSLGQLKITQEIITILVFMGFSYFYMSEPINRNFLWASLCMVGAAYFVFRGN